MKSVASSLLCLGLCLLLIGGSGGCSRARSAVAQPKYQGPKLVLRTTFPAGRYALEAGVDECQTLLMAGSAQTVRSRQVLASLLRVMPVDAAGNQEVRFNYMRVALKSGELAYDSDMPLETPGQNLMLAAIVRPLVGPMYTATIDRAGRVRVAGLDEVWDRMLTGSKKNAELTAIYREMKRQLGNKSGDLVLPQAWMLCDDPVGPGDRWRIVRPHPAIGEDVTYDCVLRDIEVGPEGRLAIVGFHARHERDGKVRGGDRTTGEIQDIVFEQSGVLTLNVDTGMVTMMSFEFQTNFTESLPTSDGGRLLAPASTYTGVTLRWRTPPAESQPTTR